MRDDTQRKSGEVGATSGKTHEEVLEETLGRERAQKAKQGPPPTSE